MILTELRRVLQTQGPLSLGEIAKRLDSSPEAVRSMLEIWIEKGRVSRLATAEGCGSSCQGCAVTQTEYYAWRGRGEMVVQAPTCRPPG
jgi:hypothetical protein